MNPDLIGFEVLAALGMNSLRYNAMQHMKVN
jgi:hypothetical protein